MKVKHHHYTEQFNNAPILLQIIAYDFRTRSLEFGIEPVITRITDTVEGESGVHPQERGLDFRDFHMNGCLYTEEQSQSIVHYINGKYQRIDDYLVCIHHGDPKHFHLQIPLQTIALRGPLWRE